MIKKIGLAFIIVLFSVSIVSALDETARCDVGNDGCNFVWDVVNASDKSQKIDWPCNVTVYDGAYTEVWSVLSDVTNKWHNVSMPVGSTFNDDWYHVERNCNGTLSSFNFEVNTTLSNINVTLANVTVEVDASDVWGYTLSNNLTAEENLTESGSSMYAMAIILISLIFFYLAFEVDGEQFELLRIMFVFVGIYLIMIGLQAMVVMSSANAGLNSIVNTSLQLTGYILVVMIFFLLIQIIRNIYDIMVNRKIKVM